MFQNIKTENREEETINSYTKKKKKKKMSLQTGGANQMLNFRNKKIPTEIVHYHEIEEY